MFETQRARRASICAAALAALRVATAAELPTDETRALPCRPTIACTADIVPPGTFEIEGGYMLRRLSPATWQHSTPLLLKLTVLEWLQVQVGTNGGIFTNTTSTLPRAAYLDDVLISLKLHLHEQEAYVPSFSFSATASLPTFTGQPGYVRTYDAFFIVYLTKDFGRLHADLNLGLNLWRLGQPSTQEFAALALSLELPYHLTAMVEAYGFTDSSPINAADAGLLAGLSVTVRPWLVFDAGADLGLIRSYRTFSLFVGFTVVPVLLWRHQGGSRNGPPRAPQGAGAADTAGGFASTRANAASASSSSAPPM